MHEPGELTMAAIILHDVVDGEGRAMRCRLSNRGKRSNRGFPETQSLLLGGGLHADRRSGIAGQVVPGKCVETRPENGQDHGKDHDT